MTDRLGTEVSERRSLLTEWGNIVDPISDTYLEVPWDHGSSILVVTNHTRPTLQTF